MASQITHIVLADKLYPLFFTQFTKREFYIGTVFPDIRYLGSVSREATHFSSLTFQDVVGENNSFIAGQKLHCLIDISREQYVTEAGLYTLLSDTPWKDGVPKLLEDELLYEKITNWPEK